MGYVMKLLNFFSGCRMRGVLSEAMVMCASSPENVEILDPPPGSIPGERITFQGYTGEWCTMELEESGEDLRYIYMCKQE